MPHPYRTRAGDDDPLGAVRRRADALVERGMVTADKGRSRLMRAAGPLRIHALTQAAVDDEARNVDRVLVRDTTIEAEPALVVAIAHGSDDDEASALASAAVVGELASRLEAPLLAPADVGAALVRALHGCDDVVRELAHAPADVRGGGASVIVGIVARGYGTLLHVGDVRALVVRDGVARQLVAPHVLAFDANFRKRLPFAARDRAWLAGDATHGVEGGALPRLDPIRFPFERGTRLVLGHGGLDLVRAELEVARAADDTCDRCAAALRAQAPSSTATLAIVDA